MVTGAIMLQCVGARVADIIQPIQTVAEYVSIWAVGSQRSAKLRTTVFNCAGLKQPSYLLCC